MASFLSTGCALTPHPTPVASLTLRRSLEQMFGLRIGGGGGRVKCMASAYTVKLITPEGEKSISVSQEDYILDMAEESGVDLPYSCRAGACSTCVGKVVEGSVDQEDQSFLDDELMGEGWVLTCVARPTSNLVVKTHMEDEFPGPS